jgi:hypothetical protein
VKKRTLKFAEFWTLCKRELNYDLFNWKESKLLNWILDSRNSLTLRRFIVDFWLWKHRNRKQNYSVIYNKGKLNEHTVVCNNSDSLDFWLPIFKERKLM